MFEGNEIFLTDPNPELNFNRSFGVTMWVYITDIPGSHTLMCKQNPHPTGPGMSLCYKYDQASFYVVVETFDNVSQSKILEEHQVSGMIPQCNYFLNQTL